MKDSLEQPVIIRGKPYRYDADFDAYYRVHEPEHTVSRYSWLVITVLLAAICWYVEYARL